MLAKGGWVLRQATAHSYFFVASARRCEGSRRCGPCGMSSAATDSGALHSFAAAGIAAALELSIMQPLDVVKTRLQLQSSQLTTADHYSSTLHALRKIHMAEGMAGLWRGFGTGLAIVVPRRGFKVADAPHTHTPHTFTFALHAVCSHTLTATLACPFWLCPSLRSTTSSAPSSSRAARPNDPRLIATWWREDSPGRARRC